MEKVRILGLSATPIKGGNCDTAVQEALKSAKVMESPELGEVETEFITLAGKEIAMCKHCQWCIENRSGCKFQDDSQMVFDAMRKCDGLIIGTPTWTNALMPLFPILMSRARTIAFFTHDFRNKVVGFITLGFLGFGYERCLDSIKNITLPFNMIPVAEAPVTGTTRAFGQRPEYLEHGVLDDTWGMTRVRMVGPRVVEVARMIKYATINGIVIPEEYNRTYVGGKARKLEDMVFEKGVWRAKA